LWVEIKKVHKIPRKHRFLADALITFKINKNQITDLIKSNSEDNN